MADPRVWIGNQSAASAQPWDLPWRYALAHGFDAFEWFPDAGGSGRGWSAPDIPSWERQRIRCLACAGELRLSLHASLRANALEAAGQACLAEDLQLAWDLGAALLNLHLDLGAGMARFVQALKPIARSLGQSGMILALENTVHDGPAELNAVFEELGAAGLLEHGGVGLCFDMGHANLHQATRNDYLRFFDELDESVPIVHLHAHENHGDRDSHLPLFTGPARLDSAGVEGLLERLCDRSFTGSIIFEQWPRPPDLLVQARDRVRQMLRTRPRR